MKKREKHNFAKSFSYVHYYERVNYIYKQIVSECNKSRCEMEERISTTIIAELKRHIKDINHQHEQFVVMIYK